MTGRGPDGLRRAADRIIGLPLDGADAAGGALHASQLRYFLVLLLAADALFAAAHIIGAVSTLIPSPLAALNRDRGYPEIFQYIKLYWIVLTVGALWWRTRAPVYAGWSVAFSYLLADDALQIHERWGASIAAARGYGALAGLRAQDLGELVVTAAAGLVLLGLIGIGYRRSGGGARQASKGLVARIAALAFFGVVVDMVHQTAGGTRLGDLLLVVEDGGEMLVVSVTCAYAAGVLLRGSRVPARLEEDAEAGAAGKR